MVNTLFRKGFAFAIIILFIGSFYVPSAIGFIEKKTSFKVINTRGYIQDLIDNSSNGDTIHIPSGIYYENIIINKSISLVGEDKETTIIDGGGTGDVVDVYADWVNISRFTIKNGGAYNGISIHSDYNNIYGNTITLNIYNGIGLFEYSNNNYITDNVISNNLWGIYLTFSCNNTFTRNTITSNGNAGIRITDSSNNNLITYNNFSSTFTNHGHIEILYSYFNTIKHNNFIRKLGLQTNFGYHWSEDNMCNYWNENYWNRPRILPKPIFGFILFDTVIGFVPIPWINIDWRPALRPYDI